MDRITGKSYRDTHSGFDVRVAQIINDRTANKRLVTNPNQLSPQHVARELSEYVCSKLNGNTRYCRGGASATATPVPFVAGRKCPHCGSEELRPIICAPCGGKRTGYRCNKCGKESK